MYETRPAKGNGPTAQHGERGVAWRGGQDRKSNDSQGVVPWAGFRGFTGSFSKKVSSWMVIRIPEYYPSIITRRRKLLNCGVYPSIKLSLLEGVFHK